MIRTGLTYDERMRIKAEQEAEAKAYYDRLFPPSFALAAARLTQRRATRSYRPASEYAESFDKLCANLCIDPDVQEENIAMATIAVRKKKKGGTAA